MGWNARVIVVLVAACCAARYLPAQEHHHTESSSTEQLGIVSFPVSCSASVEPQFERGVALLHSFSYHAAQAQFEAIEKADPGCAMAYWGQAMTVFRQLWDRPSQEDLERGHALIQRAQEIGAKTDRERGYIAAAAAFYRDDVKATYDSRVSAYSRALEQLHERFPEDDEAATFYALSLIASPDADKNGFAYRKKAVAILNEVLLRRPNHPGDAHYLIHACDNPEMAIEALPAARRYAQIAPASAHAVHMPSHIFARLGLWQDDVASNLASAKIAQQQGETADRMHAMDFLEYAYLQLGRFDEAKAVETEALSVPEQQYSKDMAFFSNYVQVHFPSLLAIETKDWKAACRVVVPTEAGPEYAAVSSWARAVGAGHMHDVASANDAVQSYDRAQEAVRKSSYAWVAEHMNTSRDEAHAWLAFAQGNTAEAVRLLSSAADEQDRIGKGEVEIPAREMLADVLLESNRPQDALAQYATSLKTDPNRFNSLCGAARAAELAGEPEEARKYYRALLAGREQSQNAELIHAREYLDSGRS